MAESTEIMLKVGEGIYYKGIGLMKYKTILYSISITGVDYYRSWIPVIMHYTDSPFVKYTKIPDEGAIHVGMTFIEGDEEMDFVFILNGTKHQLGIMHSLRKIQRAMRRVLHKRKLERFTALAMGLHPRLGRQSGVGGLCADILDIITL